MHTPAAAPASEAPGAAAASKQPRVENEAPTTLAMRERSQLTLLQMHAKSYQDNIARLNAQLASTTRMDEWAKLKEQIRLSQDELFEVQQDIAAFGKQQ